MAPENQVERIRAATRANIDLAADRVVRQETRNRRFALISNFRRWLWLEHGVSFRALLDEKPVDAEKVCNWLIRFGRALFESGKSYNHYSETINAVVMMKPILKRQMTHAWSLAFSWLSGEPHEHHPALPVSILLAMMTTALYWGWPYVAAVLGLTWAGVLRIGEVLQATRRDLYLPRDRAPGEDFVLLRIQDPKTRGRSARHQSARVDQIDIVNLLDSVYGSCDSSFKLWPFSGATLRNRFNCLLKALDLPTTKKPQLGRPFELSSLRPGGATWMLNVTENSELVRRRGRWLSHRVMEVYLQEVQVATYLYRLQPHQRQKILNLALAFEPALAVASDFLDNAIPPRTWFYLMKAQRNGREGNDGDDHWQQGHRSTDPI